MSAWLEDVRYVVNHVQVYCQRFPSRSRDRRKTAFYWAVQGGNVELARHSLMAIQETGMDSELSWLLNLAPEAQPCSSFCEWLRRVVLLPGQLLTVLMLFFLALTPLFRIVHNTLSRFVIRGEESADSDLPLFLATLSRKKDMIKLLRSYGVTLNQADPQGRNIFHLLVNYSTGRQQTLALYRMLVEEYSDSQELKDAIQKQTNQNGLTPLEACIKYGCARLLRAFFNTEHTIRETMATIRGHQFTVARRRSSFMRKQGEAATATVFHNHHCQPERDNREVRRLQQSAEVQEPADSPDSYQRIRYDVSEYETGGFFNRQSRILLLLTYRDLTQIDADTVKQLWRNPVLLRWAELKRAAVKPLIVTNQLHRFALFVVTTYFAVYVVNDMFSHPMVNQLIKDLIAVEERRILEASSITINATVADVCEQTFHNLSGMVLNDCQHEVFQGLTRGCSGLNLSEFLSDKGFQKVSDIWLVDSFSSTFAPLLLLAAIMVYGTSTLSKLIFLVQGLRPYCLGKGLRHVFAVGMPGSSTEDVLMCTMSWSIILLALLIRTLNGETETTSSVATLISAIEHVFSCYVLLCLVCWLLAMRLWPVVGHYILVTKRLVSTLLQFLFMYVLVVAAIASLLQFVMWDTQCPLNALQGFATIQDSVFEVFKLTFSAGDFVYGLSEQSKILYVVFMILGVLLLLNLVIAVMSSATDRFFSQPWEQCIWYQEHVRECLHLELFVNALVWLFRAHDSYLRYLGYVVEEKVGETKVYIEVEKWVSSVSDNA